MGRGFFLLSGALVLRLAAACDRTNPPALTVGDVLGCYEVVDSADRPLPSQSGFWSAPVRLDTLQNERSRAWSLSSSDHPWYVMKPTARIADSASLDTVILQSFWTIRQPDTLVLLRSSGLFGEAISLQRAAPPNFEGTHVMRRDEIDPKNRAVPRPVSARRVDCPAAAAPAV